MSDVQLCEIRKSHAGRPILGSVDGGFNLDIPSGQYTVLLGPSGCGKTTLLNVIAGLDGSDSGTVLIHGNCVDKLPPRKRNLSYVFQRDSLYPHLTVAESIRLGLKGLSASEIEGRVKAACQLAGIASLVDRHPEHLSGGELRRAAIAKSISSCATVRLLDEPLSALDASVRHEIQNALLDWHHQHPGTTIHVTHDGHEAMRIADRIAVLGERLAPDGSSLGSEVVQYATPAEIYDAPANKTVALSLGLPPISFLTASVVNGSVQRRGEGWSLACSDAFSPVVNQPIEIAFRPQSCQLCSAGEGDARGDASVESGLTLTSEIRRVYFSNGRRYAEMKVGGATVTVDSTGWDVSVGDTLRVRVDEASLYRFDSLTGQTLPN